jgi:hypothetical protein
MCPPEIEPVHSMRRDREMALTMEPRRAGKRAPDAKSLFRSGQTICSKFPATDITYETLGTSEYAARPVSQTRRLVPQPSKIACLHSLPSTNPLRSNDSFQVQKDVASGVFRSLPR